MMVSSAYMFATQITAGEPPIPPSPPEWWINSRGVNPVYSVQGYAPYISFIRGQQYDIYADFGYNYNIAPQFCINGGLEIGQYQDGYSFDIPLYDSYERLSRYKIRYMYGEQQETARPQSGVQLYDGETLIDNVGYVKNWPLQGQVYKVLAYAGANVFNGRSNMLYGGLAVLMVNVNNGFWLSHLGGAIDLTWLETTYGVHLGSNWLS